MKDIKSQKYWTELRGIVYGMWHWRAVLRDSHTTSSASFWRCPATWGKAWLEHIIKVYIRHTDMIYAHNVTQIVTHIHTHVYKPCLFDHRGLCRESVNWYQLILEWDPPSKQNGGSSSRVTIVQYIHMHMYTESVTDMLDTDMHCIYII